MTLARDNELLKAQGRYDAMIERERRREEDRQKGAAELQRAEAPLVQELQAVGYAVNSGSSSVHGELVSRRDAMRQEKRTGPGGARSADRPRCCALPL